MTQVDPYRVLNDSLIRLYRSFGHYLDSAAPRFDIGRDELLRIIEEQKADAATLGEMIARGRGFVEPGSYPHRYSGTHFLNSSGLLRFWIPEQEHLLAGLQADRKMLPDDFEGAQLLDGVIERTREQLKTLQELHRGATDAQQPPSSDSPAGSMS